MRSKFRGHFSETQETIDELWQSATFVFDANVLLNLYRYSDKTRTEFVRILNSIRERVWIPEQCAYEYFSNRITVIDEQEQAYKSVAAELEQIEKRFSGTNRHPFLTKASHDELSKVLKKISNELEKSKNAQVVRYSRDDIKNTLANVFEGCVGDPYDSDTMQALFDEGATRYADNVPPGYKDKNKVKDPKTVADKRRNFGDLIVWKQTIDRAKEAQTDVIFVTDDSKEDWWQKHGSRTIAPRPELIDEFCSKTQRTIMIYSPDKFIEFAEKQLGSKVSAGTLDEVKADYTKHLNEEALVAAMRTLERISPNRRKFMEEVSRARNHVDTLNKSTVIKELIKSRSELQNEISRVKERLEFWNLIGDDADKDQIKALSNMQEELTVSLAMCERQIFDLKRPQNNSGVFD